MATPNTYTGGTTVNAGTLIVTGTAGSGLGLGSGGTGSGAVTVNSGGTLAGTGTVYGTTTVNTGGTLSPGTGGNTVGLLSVGNGGATSGLTLNGAYRIDLDGTSITAGVYVDGVIVKGALTLNAASSTLVIGSVINHASLQAGQQYFIAFNDGTDPVVGTFSNATLLAPTVTDSYGDVFTVSYTANGDGGTLGNDVSLTVSSVAPVPEPTTLLAGALTVLGGLAAWRRQARA